MTASTKEAVITADPDIPTITITREFDAPAERVYRAWEDPAIVAQWMGPDSGTIEIAEWDCRTGGSYRYQHRSGHEVAGFFGSFHEARPGERLVQTFTYDGFPDGVSLETMTFEDLPGGRCRIVAVSVVDSMQAQAGMMASGMEVGINEGYAKLDALLAKGKL